MEDNKVILRKILGLFMKDFLLLEDGPLILYFGGDQKPAKKSNSIRFWLYGAWRLEKKTSISVGNADRTQVILKQLREISGKRLISILVSEPSKDLAFNFGKDIKLISFHNDAHFERWEMRCPDGYRLSVTRSGKIIKKFEPELEKIRMPKKLQEN